jgi:transposase InsO family protein
VPHRNAPLSELGRLRLARCIVDDEWSLRRAAERFQVSVTTADRWARRYRDRDRSRPAVEAMRDRSSRPRRSPRQTPAPVARRVLHLRRTRGWGPARIAHRLGMAPSTAHRVLTRAGAARLSDVDLATRRELRRQVRRYERERPGELVHVDIKKLGRIPDGGGHRTHGRQQGGRNSRASTPVRKNRHPVLGYGYVHTAIDDHSRLAYSEVHPDEQGATAAAFWRRAVAWFAAHGITVERVLTDNGACYRSKPWADACADTGAVHKRTRPYRPQTNGKVERFNRTLLTEWAYARPYSSERARLAALPKWLHIYNHHRHHTALGGLPPVSRVPNLSGQNI